MVMSGAIDWLSDGETTLKVSNGHKYQGDITASGCILGTCVATFCAAINRSALVSSTLDEDGRLVAGDMLTASLGG